MHDTQARSMDSTAVRLVYTLRVVQKKMVLYIHDNIAVLCTELIALLIISANVGSCNC